MSYNLIGNYIELLICFCMHMDEVYITYGNWELCFFYRDKPSSSAKGVV